MGSTQKTVLGKALKTGLCPPWEWCLKPVKPVGTFNVGGELSIFGIDEKTELAGLSSF